MSGRFRRKRKKNAPNPDKLAPPEEKVGPANDGAPTVRISSDLMDGADNGSIFRMDPIVIAILIGAVAFIAFIAWEISRAPWPPLER